MLSYVLDVASFIGQKTLCYPVEYAKVLIQLGYEPLQPRLSTFLGNRSYMYPNVFGHVGHIFRTDGFFGMYRGFGFMLTEFVVRNSVTISLETIFLKFQKDYEFTPDIDDVDFSTFLKDFLESQKDFKESPNDDVNNFSTFARDKSHKDFEEAPNIDDVDDVSIVVRDKSHKDFEEAPNDDVNNFSTFARDFLESQKDFKESPNNDFDNFLTFARNFLKSQKDFKESPIDDFDSFLTFAENFLESQTDFKESPNHNVDNFLTFSKNFLLSRKEFKESPDDDVDDFSTVVRNTALRTISVCVGIICSQPFRVIYLRSLAQFVGRETRFSSLFSAVPDIWKNEGILGFFAGLVPRLVSEALIIVITKFLGHALYCIFVKVKRQTNNEIKNLLSLMSVFIACQIAYPITLTSVVMAVSPSKLEAVSPPNMPSYDSWLACLRHLNNESQKYRGLFLFCRKYMGPRVHRSGIVMPPIEHQK